MAKHLLTFIVKDSDGEYIVDYAGPTAKERFAAIDTSTMVASAHQFAVRFRSEQRERGEDGKKLFERYSQVVRYLEARLALWGLPHSSG